ncbi:MAG: ATP-binding protein [Brevinematales bacterium]|nr:ATP-binding protein [Brevinematales bacterium]
MHFYLTDAIFDLVQNSIEADATFIVIDIVENDYDYDIFISDNGKGIEKDKLDKVFNPDTTEVEKHKNRKFGLGLSFIKHQCDLVNGKIEIDSIVGEGTSIHIKLPKTHPDTPPMGDIAGLVTEIFMLSDDCEIVFNRYLNDKKYEIIKSKIVSDDMKWVKNLKEYINQFESSIVEIEVK